MSKLNEIVIVMVREELKEKGIIGLNDVILRSIITKIATKLNILSDIDVEVVISTLKDRVINDYELDDDDDDDDDFRSDEEDEDDAVYENIKFNFSEIADFCNVAEDIEYFIEMCDENLNYYEELHDKSRTKITLIDLQVIRGIATQYDKELITLNEKFSNSINLITEKVRNFGFIWLT